MKSPIFLILLMSCFKMDRSRVVAQIGFLSLKCLYRDKKNYFFIGYRNNCQGFSHCRENFAFLLCSKLVFSIFPKPRPAENTHKQSQKISCHKYVWPKDLVLKSVLLFTLLYTNVKVKKLVVKTTVSVIKVIFLKN